MQILNSIYHHASLTFRTRCAILCGPPHEWPTAYAKIRPDHLSDIKVILSAMARMIPGRKLLPWIYGYYIIDSMVR